MKIFQYCLLVNQNGVVVLTAKGILGIKKYCSFSHKFKQVSSKNNFEEGLNERISFNKTGYLEVLKRSLLKPIHFPKAGFHKLKFIKTKTDHI